MPFLFKSLLSNRPAIAFSWFLLWAPEEAFLWCLLNHFFLVTFASSLENCKTRVASLLFKCCWINCFKLQAPLLQRYQLSFPLARPDDQMKANSSRATAVFTKWNTRRDYGEIIRIIALLMDCNRYSASRDFCYNLRLNLQWGATRLVNMLCKHLSYAPKRDGSLYDPRRLSQVKSTLKLCPVNLWEGLGLIAQRFDTDSD